MATLLHLNTAVLSRISVAIYNVENILLISLDVASKLTLEERRPIILIHMQLAPFSLFLLFITYSVKTEQPPGDA